VIRHTISFLFCLLATSLASAGTLTTFDFSTDDGGASIVNGQKIDTEYSSAFTVSVPFGLGAAAFDSSPSGPNIGDPGQADLLVDLGNVLIYQSRLLPTQTTAGIYDTPVDDVAGGTIIFDFTSPSQPTAITLIDLDTNAGAEVRLTDTAGNKRTYSLPDNWTTDGRIPPGYAVLDLVSLADQSGGTALLSSVTEDAGYDGSNVNRMEVQLFGSGALDNLVLNVVPEPTTLTGVFLMLGAMVGFVRRQR
jgi:hypothetical protein